MNRNAYLANAVLWAASILASAAMDAPLVLTLGLLPVLASGALLMTRPTSRTA